MTVVHWGYNLFCRGSIARHNPFAGPNRMVVLCVGASRIMCGKACPLSIVTAKLRSLCVVVGRIPYGRAKANLLD